MTDLVPKEAVLALVERAREECHEPKFRFLRAILADIEKQIRALPAVDPRSDLEALRDEFATPAALNQEGDSECK